jgi:hypothetical protein
LAALDGVTLDGASLDNRSVPIVIHGAEEKANLDKSAAAVRERIEAGKKL